MRLFPPRGPRGVAYSAEIGDQAFVLGLFAIGSWGRGGPVVERAASLLPDLTMDLLIRFRAGACPRRRASRRWVLRPAGRVGGLGRYEG